MKVIQGRVPTEMLNSRITLTDRENLSILMPSIVQTAPSQLEQPFTYQDVYEEVQKMGIRTTDVSAGQQVSKLSQLIPAPGQI